MGRLASLLDVRQGEGLPAALLGLYAFILGLSRIFLVPSQALFLSKYNADQLAWVYLASSIATVLISAVMLRLSRRYSPLMVLFVNLSITASMTLGIYLAANLLPYRWPFLLLMAWSIAMYALSSLAFWGAASRLFDVRQGKRLFSLVSAGDVVAYVVGGFALGPLSHFLGTLQVVALSVGGSVGAGLLLFYLSRLYPVRLAGHGAGVEASSRKTSGGSTALLRSPYVRLIAVYFVMSGLIYIFVDNAFNAAAQAHFGADDSVALARFFGNYAAVTAVINLLFRSFVSGRLINRFGLVVGLAALPAALLIGAGTVTLSGLLLGGGAITFWAMTSTRVSDKVLRGVQNASLATVYQPLQQDASRAQTLMEGIIDPLAFGAAALILLLIDLVTKSSAVLLCALVVGLCTVWLAVTWVLRRGYAQALRALLDRRRLPVADLDLESPEVTEHLRRWALEGSADDALSALALLERKGGPAFHYLVCELLRVGGEELQPTLLGLVEAHKLAVATEAVRGLLEQSDKGEIRAAAMQVLCALGDEQDIARGVDSLEDPEPGLASGALVGLLRSGSEEAAALAGDRLGRLSGSPSAGDRILAATLLARVTLDDQSDLLSKLLDDDEREVQGAALASAGGELSGGCWSRVVALLSVSSLSALAGAALARGGGGAVDAMAKALGSREGDDHTAKQMLRILGELGGVAAQELLWRQALIRKGAARLVALQSLSASGFLAEGRNHDAAELLRLETAGAAKLFAARRTLGKEERWIILRRALSDEIDLRRVSILACLSLMADRATVVQAADALQTGGAETSAYALEALESVLDRQTRDLTFPVLEEISEDERTQRLAQHAGPEPADEDEVLDTLLSGELSADVDVWTRWCAFYLAQASGRPGVGQLMELWSGDADPWLRQAAAWNGELEHGAEEACAAPPFAAAMGTLQQAEVFGASPDQVLVRLARGSEHRVLQTGEVLFSEGDPGDALYIVEEGQIHAQRGGERVGSFGPGEIFGEFTVLIDGARTATIKAAEPSTILSIPRARLLEVIAARSVLGVRLLGALVRRLLDAEHPPPPAAPAAQKADISSSHASPADLHRALLLRRSALFGAMDPQALAGISPLFEQRFYPAGSPVITEGETGDRLYVVASGRLSVSCDSTTLRELGDGAVFGERALLLDEPRSASVSAVEDTELLELPNNLFRRMLLEKPQTIQGLVWDVLARYR